MKLFADEEAIETVRDCVQDQNCVQAVKLFADEEAIETMLQMMHPPGQTVL